jgi:hypothetical protein
MRLCALAALTLAALAVASCGIFTFPVSLGAAVAHNASFSFKGKITDAGGQALDGVLVKPVNSHHVWTPLAGAKDLDSVLIRRADGKFEFENRRSWCEFTFSREGYQDACYRMTAGQTDTVFTRDGLWKYAENSPVVLLSAGTPAFRYELYIQKEPHSRSLHINRPT